MTNERIIVLGAGESGTGAALLAKAKGFDVFVSDQGAIKEKYVQQLEKSGIDYEQGKHTEEKIFEAGTIIKSPGIPESARILQGAFERGIGVIDEIEFASRYTDARFIAITGTNGKTTTTLLTYHLLKSAGYNVGLAGNVGHSLAKQVLEEHFDFYVVEMSSFQIDGIQDFSPEIAILLNITPDHLDRYQYSLQNYINSKFKLVEALGKESHFIYLNDDNNIATQLAAKEYAANHLPITLSADPNSVASIIGSEMHFTLEGNNFDILQSDTTLKGKHNLVNTMAAVIAAIKVGLSESEIREGLKTFKNAPHRMEFVATINEVDFYNDSKATNVEATKYALESFTNKLVWIAGGVDKGNDYNQLMELVNSKVKALVCLGKDNGKLRDSFHEHVVDLIETKSMQEAVGSALNYATANDVVLLSPACASFDLFNNYEDRGDQFRQAVMNLKQMNN